jgi:hypothetical protein
MHGLNNLPGKNPLGITGPFAFIDGSRYQMVHIGSTCRLSHTLYFVLRTTRRVKKLNLYWKCFFTGKRKHVRTLPITILSTKFNCFLLYKSWDTVCTIVL